MFCNWVFVEHGRNSEQVGSDPLLAIGQIAIEVDLLAFDTFHNFVLLSVEAALTVGR